jgi:hypothetical protein
VSLATDGLDAAGALAAAGVGGTDRFDGFAVGQVLYGMLEERERPAERPVRGPAGRGRAGQVARAV